MEKHLNGETSELIKRASETSELIKKAFGENNKALFGIADIARKTLSNTNLNLINTSWGLSQVARSSILNAITSSSILAFQNFDSRNLIASLGFADIARRVVSNVSQEALKSRVVLGNLANEVFSKNYNAINYGLNMSVISRKALETNNAFIHSNIINATMFSERIAELSVLSTALVKRQWASEYIESISSNITAKIFGNVEETVNLNEINIPKIKEISFEEEANPKIPSEDISFELQEIQNKIDEVVDEKRTIESKLNSLILLVGKQKNPVIKQIVIGVVVGLITAIIWVFIGGYIQRFKVSPKQERKIIVKSIKKEFKNIDIKAEIIKGYRVVTANSLCVRVTHSKKSKAVAILNLGDVVNIIKRNRNWSLVELNCDDVNVRGWVFTRYLSKLK